MDSEIGGKCYTLSFAEAEKTCSSYGYRMCTDAEVENKKTKGAGGVPILNYIFQISSNGMTFENIAGDDSGYLLEVDTTTNPSLVTVTVKRLTALTHYYFRVSASFCYFWRRCCEGNYW